MLFTESATAAAAEKATTIGQGRRGGGSVFEETEGHRWMGRHQQTYTWSLRPSTFTFYINLC